MPTEPQPTDPYRAPDAEPPEPGSVDPPRRRVHIGDFIGFALLWALGSELAWPVRDGLSATGRALTSLTGPVIFVVFRLRPMRFWPAYGIGFLGCMLPVLISLLLHG